MMVRIFVAAAAVVVLLSPLPGLGQQVPTGFLDRTVDFEGASYAYQVYVPRDYDATTEWPVILFLHGAGERGSGGVLQTEVGLPSAIRRAPERYPAIVVMPQTPEETIWQGRMAEMAMAALEQAEAEFTTDADRVYLTGLSLGGNGSWYLAHEYADRFAALAVVCGWVGDLFQIPTFVSGTPTDPYAALAERIEGLPTWIFHGGADSVVPVEESQKMLAALEAAGADVQYTEYPGVDHNSWDETYRAEDLPTWLFQQRRHLSGASGAPPAFVLGEFMDDYGNRLTITHDTWTQHPGMVFHVVMWRPDSSFMVGRNDAGNAADVEIREALGIAPEAGLWTRIDWVALPDNAPYEWGFCISEYRARSVEAAVATDIADPLTPRTGCNGFPYSRMQRVDPGN